MERVICYIDDQDPQDIGWAYRVEYADGHEESGAMDAQSGDGPALLSEMEGLVVAHGGAWAGSSPRSGVTYHDHGGGESYRWESEAVRS